MNNKQPFRKLFKVGNKKKKKLIKIIKWTIMRIKTER